MRRLSAIVLLFLAAFLGCGAQEYPKMTLERAELLVPRKIKAPVKSLVDGECAVGVDTLDTSDPHVKLVLRADRTWDYVRDLKSLDDSGVYSESWNTNVLNPYRTTLSELPPRVTLWLVDTLSGWKCPNRIAVFSKYGIRHGRRHTGVDLPLRTGTPVYAAFDGKVRYSNYYKAYGNVVIIRHPNGLETTYAHLSERSVSAGDWVRAGDVIGLGGSTGRSTGPHLHFETRYRGFAFDPQWIADYQKGELRYPVFVLKSKYLTPQSTYVPESEDEEEEIYKSEEEERAEAERLAAELAAAKYHKISSGDTLSGLAVKYHTTVSEICRLNGITPKTTLKIGRSIRVK